MRNKLYAFCAIDQFTKYAVLRIATTAPGLNSRTAPEEVGSSYRPDIIIVNDTGSENKGKAGAFPAEKEIIQYLTTLYAPMEKPHIEHFIGTFQRECPDYHYEPMNAAGLQALAGEVSLLPPPQSLPETPQSLV